MTLESKSFPGNVPRIGVIGCGAFAEKFYLPALVQHPHVFEELILVDRNEERVHELASAYNVENIVYDYQEILNDVDGVIVSVPHQLHYPITMDFLLGGVNVLCDKPLAVSTIEAKEMVSQAEKSGVYLCVNNTRRLFPAYQNVKELISKGEIGSPLSIRFIEGWEMNAPSMSGFRFNPKTARTGVLMDQGAHVLDAICWWLAEKPTLKSCENDSFGGIDAVTIIKFEHKQCIGEIRLSWLNQLENKYRIIGEHGVIEGDVTDWRTISITSKSGVEKKIKQKFEVIHYQDIAYKLINNFLDVIINDQKPLIPGIEVLPSIDWIDECYTGATRIKMPWFEPLEVSYGG